MPRPRNTTPPKYRLHKPSGKAVVTIAGRDHYLGKHGSPESVAEYDRLISGWLAGGRVASTDPAAEPGAVPATLTVSELAVVYLREAKTYYGGSGELVNVEHAMAPVVRLFGRVAADAFTPVMLHKVREAMMAGTHMPPRRDRKSGRVPGPLSIKTINARTHRIRRVFRWGVARSLVRPDVLLALNALEPLKPGRCQAKPSVPVRPVADAIVDATLPHLPPLVASMVRIQRLTGMRSGELVIMRTCDIDRSGDVWVYTPSKHKTDYRGHDRQVYIGPVAQKELEPYLKRELTAFVFSPREAAEKRNIELRKNRKTRVQPSQRNRRKRSPKRVPGERYTSQSYGRAIYAACLKHEIPAWHPHQLRHSMATKLRRDFGVESSKTVLGHASLPATLIYAERDQKMAADVIRKIG